MNELMLCMAGAILLLVVACALLWAQIVWLKTDIKEFCRSESEPCYCGGLSLPCPKHSSGGKLPLEKSAFPSE